MFKNINWDRLFCKVGDAIFIGVLVMAIAVAFTFLTYLGGQIYWEHKRVCRTFSTRNVPDRQVCVDQNVHYCNKYEFQPAHEETFCSQWEWPK